ncbi:nicotinate-nucleotide adenylyltransferase [Salegentibacter chungangensis]|uniref:Nicotinate-nucleotide adenylyltransferase n=1 Tax=Salegentibacter chungangensis TaxID=1335724 RepID=A0ABW3NMG1_9FLAO
MKKLMLSLLVLGLGMQVWAQEPQVEELSEVRIKVADYKYLDKTNAQEVSVPVKMLREEVAKFDVKNSAYYQDDYDLYQISFYIPEGRILAAYDQEGNLLKTVERFKDVALPKTVTKAVASKYPKWSISKDVYLVNYEADEGAKKKYRLRLENGGKRIWVKTDENGNFY